MLKKIIESLKIKPYSKVENFYFRENADGNYTFYPWGEPGEAYIINQFEKRKINRALDITILIILFIALGLIYLINIPDAISAGGIVIISVNIALYVGFGLFYFYIKREKQKFNIFIEKNTVITEKKDWVKKVFKDIIYLDLFVLAALFVNPQDLLLWFLGSIVITLNPYFLYVLYKKSYFFQKKIPLTAESETLER